MKRIISLILMLLLLAATASCGGDGVSSTSSADVTTTPPPEPVSLLKENGEAAYRIVRPDKTNSDTLDSIDEFKRSLNSLTGTEFLLITDKVLDNEAPEGVAEVYEILIGATNRSESIAAKEGLTENDYVIRIDGKKIVIAGGSDLMTVKALNAFYAMLDSENGFTLEGDLNIKKEIERGTQLVALTNQGKWRLQVYDITDGKLDEDSLVWSYKTPYRNIAGVKFRHSEKHGDVVLTVCGNRYGCMVSYPEGNVIWSTEAAASNPHSIELLPNGIVAIASSDGNEVRFFKTDERSSKTPDAKMTLGDAHGVLWDPEREVLWAVGRNVLTAYRVTLNNDGSVTVTEDTSLKATIPSGSAHDLAPVYGNKNELWITTGSHVYRYNKTEKTFSVDYEGHEILDIGGVKGVGNFENGDIVYIYPDGEYESWTSKSAYMIKNGEGSEMTSEDGHFYKIRVWDVRYQ